MNWIDDYLAVGDVEDAKNHTMLRLNNIVLSIDVRCVFGGEFEAWAPIPDRVWKLVHGLRIMTMRHGFKTLIHCHGGIDRAPFIAMLYIFLTWTHDIPEAYKLVREKRPQTIEHWEWVEQMLYQEQRKKLINVDDALEELRASIVTDRAGRPYVAGTIGVKRECV